MTKINNHLTKKIGDFSDRVIGLDTQSDDETGSDSLPAGDDPRATDNVRELTSEDIIDMLLLRSEIQDIMASDNSQLTGKALINLIDNDSLLLEFFKRHKSYQQELKIWRDHHQVTSEDHWWWFSDEYIFSTPEGIQHETTYTGLFLLSVLFLISSIFLTAYTAQGLFQRELNLEAIFTIGANLLWGGVLVTPIGSNVARQSLQRFVNWIGRFFPIKNLSNIPQAAGTSGLAFITFSLLVSLFSVTVSFVILPSTANLTFGWGNDALHRRDYAAALDWYTLSSKLLPRSFIGRQPQVAARLTQLGNIYVSLGARDEAITSYEAALDYDSNIIFAQIPLTDLYVDSGRLEEALILSDRSLTSVNLEDSTEANDLSIFIMRARVIRGRILMNMGFAESAIDNLELAFDELGFQADESSYYIINAHRLLAFARTMVFSEANLTGDFCANEIERIKVLLELGQRQIERVSERPPYDIWQADLTSMNAWLNIYDCSEQSRENETWVIPESF